MLRNTFRSKGESRSLSWPIRDMSVRHNMSNSIMISASCPEPGDSDMFYRDCSKSIMREKNTLC